MLSIDPIDRINAILANDSQVKFAYVFGSRARGDHNPASDIDIAVFIEDHVSPLPHRLRLMEIISRGIGSEHFDLITLNDAPPVLKYEVVRQGRVIKEDKQRRVAFEVQVIDEYLDTEHLRQTQRLYLKEQLQQRGIDGQ